MKKYVAGFMFSSDKSEVLLVEKMSPEWQRGLLNGIGGKIEGGETPLEAIIREFAEETGVETTTADWTEVVYYIRQNVYEVHFYKTFTDQIYSAVIKEKEVITKFKSDNLPLNVVSNLNWLIPLCLDDDINLTSPILVLDRN